MMTFSEALTRAVLQWYASPRSWSPTPTHGPYSSGASAAATRDSGAVARRAVAADSDGQLFAAACDAWGLSVTEVGEKAGFDGLQTALFVSGRVPLTEDGSARLLEALRGLIAERLGQ